MPSLLQPFKRMPEKPPMTTEQMNFWLGQFGKDYTDRNTYTAEGIDNTYRDVFGVSRLEMNRQFLDNLDRDIRILEVGCNIGMQLQLLQDMGFRNLTGIELQRYAIDSARSRLSGIDVIQGSALELPFRDGWFDLVYTSGVLIHISPRDLPTVMKEMARCSKRYIWGFEYYQDETTDVVYRGESGFLWKAPYSRLFQENAGPLQIVKEEKYARRSGEGTGNLDAMYLLEKKTSPTA